MPISIRLPEEIEIRLNALAEATGRTKAFYIREAIQEHLENLEDIYLAEQRIADIKAGKSRTYTIDEVEARLDLAD